MKTTAHSIIRCTAKTSVLVALVLLSQALALCGFAVSEAQAQSSGVTVLPTRVVIEEGERTAELRVTNRSDRPTVYRLEFQHMRLTREGRLEPVDTDAGDVVSRADKMLRFSPRRILLKPREVQTVRVLVRRPSDLEPGEYRSRVLFRAEPLVRPASKGGSEGNFSIALNTVSAVSLPIIVRHGQPSAKVAIDELEYHPSSDSAANSASHLALRLNREGNRSIYGALEATWQPADGGQPVVVGMVSGLAVYTEVPHIRWKLPVRGPEGKPLEDGVLRVRFYETQDGKRLAAQQELRIP